MAFDKRLMQDLRRLDRHDLRRALIFIRGLLHSQGDPAAEASADPADDGVTYRLERVRCGKPNCTSCPHGPYWYAYYRDGGRLRSRYIGPDRTGDEDGSARPEGAGGSGHPPERSD